jgi:integrase
MTTDHERREGQWPVLPVNDPMSADPLHLADPKTDTAGRVIHLPPRVQEALRAHRVRQATERLASGREWRHTGLVFTTADGEPVAEQTAHWVLARACERAGIRHVSNHDLRRFAATTITDAIGRDAAQRVLGHTSATMTDRYVSRTDDVLSRAANALEAALG